MFILCMGMGAAIYHLVKIDVTIQTIVDCQVKLTHWRCSFKYKHYYISYKERRCMILNPKLVIVVDERGIVDMI